MKSGPVKTMCPCCAARAGVAVNIADLAFEAEGPLEALALRFLMRRREREMRGQEPATCPARVTS